MGVPVVTLTGQTHTSLMGASILAAAGLRQCVAHDSGHYLSIARDLASDLPRLAALRSGMRERLVRSRLLDARSFTVDFESLLHSAWTRSATTHRP